MAFGQFALLVMIVSGTILYMKYRKKKKEENYTEIDTRYNQEMDMVEIKGKIISGLGENIEYEDDDIIAKFGGYRFTRPYRTNGETLARPFILEDEYGKIKVGPPREGSSKLTDLVNNRTLTVEITDIAKPPILIAEEDSVIVRGKLTFTDDGERVITENSNGGMDLVLDPEIELF